MKRIKSMNGYTIYQATSKRDEENYNCHIESYNIYFSSDIRDYGISFSCAEFEDIDSLEVAENLCYGNFAIAKEIAENNSTCASFDEIIEIEKKLDSGMTVEEIEDIETFIVEDVENELQSIKIPGYIGKWSAFEKCTINSREFYIMEHDTYGDMTQYLVITKDFKYIFETYDNIIICLQDEEIL